VQDRISSEARGQARRSWVRLRPFAIGTREAATRSSCARFGGDHFFGEAGTEVGCGIDDAHREWHRNRFLLLYLISLRQQPAATLTDVNAAMGNAIESTYRVHALARRTPVVLCRAASMPSRSQRPMAASVACLQWKRKCLPMTYINTRSDHRRRLLWSTSNTARGGCDAFLQARRSNRGPHP
jgi:hypothetical protein